MLKNKKNVATALFFSAIFLFFLFSVSSVSAAGCGKNQGEFSFSKFLNPLASLVEKVVKGFGHDIALAAPVCTTDFCGGDCVDCSGTTPTATVSWTAAPASRVCSPLYSIEGVFETYCSLRYYILTISGVRDFNTGLNTSYSVSSGLANNTTYNWLVEAYYPECTGPNGLECGSDSLASGSPNRPYGSFTTSNCAPPPPTASISADSTSIAYNTATTIRWSSTDATSCTVSPPGWTGTSGAQSTGNLTSSQTYTVNCSGPGGSASASVIVTVGGAPTLNFSADSTSLYYNTGTTLSWSSSNTTSCTASGDWSGAKAVSGSEGTGNLTSNKTYTLTCSGPGSSVSKSVTVSIVFLPCSDPSYPADSWDRIWCNKGLTGKLADAPDQGVLQFNDDWGNGVVAGIRADDIGFKSGRKVNLSEGLYTFTLGSDDGSKLWVDGSICIDYWADQGYTERTCQRNLSSGNHDLRIDWYENGGAARASFRYTFVPPPGDFNLNLGGSVACNYVPLSWTASPNANAYRILRGSPRVDISPYQPYTALNFTDSTVDQNITYSYQIEAYNAVGAKRSNTINVTTPYCPPTVNLSANSSSIFQGQSSTLTWATYYATSCVASNNWSGSKPLNGTETVIPYPPPSATYTLTCSGPGGSGSDSETIVITSLALPNWKEVIPR